MSWDLSKIKPTMQSVYFSCLPHDVLCLHNDHIQAQNKHTANGVLFEATHLQWRCCVREISFLITSHQLTNELGERMGRHDNRKKRSIATETSLRHTPLRIKPRMCVATQWQQHNLFTRISFTKAIELLCYPEGCGGKTLRSVSNSCSHCCENHKSLKFSQE